MYSTDEVFVCTSYGVQESPQFLRAALGGSQLGGKPFAADLHHTAATCRTALGNVPRNWLPGASSPPSCARLGRVMCSLHAWLRVFWGHPLYGVPRHMALVVRTGGGSGSTRRARVFCHHEPSYYYGTSTSYEVRSSKCSYIPFITLGKP